MIERLSTAEWQILDAAHKAPTFFARPAWALALADAFPALRPAPLRVTLAGTTVIVPLMQPRGGRLKFREYVGFPYGGYTCVLHEDGRLANSQLAGLALMEIAEHADSLDVIPWPLRETPSLPDAVCVPHETGVIDLSSGAQAALDGLAGISRRMAGQASRRGVTCAPCTDRQTGIDDYYAMLTEAAQRWGAAEPHIPRSLLAALVKHGGADVEIWFAEHEGQRIAGGVVFYGSEELFFWTAAMRHAFGRLRPSNALNVALISAAAERGMLCYNLGASEGLPGVARFKRDLGARDVPYARFRLERRRFALYSALRRTMSGGRTR